MRYTTVQRPRPLSDAAGAPTATATTAGTASAAAARMPQVLCTDAMRKMRNRMPFRLKRVQNAGWESSEQERVRLQRKQDSLQRQLDTVPAATPDADRDAEDKMRLRPRLFWRWL